MLQPPRADEGMSKSADCNFPHVLVFLALFYTKKHHHQFPQLSQVAGAGQPANQLSQFVGGPTKLVAGQMHRAKKQTNFVGPLSNKKSVPQKSKRAENVLLHC